MLFRIPILKRGKIPALKTCPKISIIFAARNEESQIAKALKSFLALDYPDYEVIAVNDRSTDGTLGIMQSFLKSETRSTKPETQSNVSDSEIRASKLKVIDVQSLPEGWLGKNHALQTGYQASSGEWLLFTDADVIFEPGVLRAVMAMMEEKSWDHMALLPKIILAGLLEKVYTSAFMLGFIIHFRPWAASNPKSKAHIGVGAFNFVRREAYEKLGTHESFRLNVLDDMELGRRVKEAGFRQSAVFGHEVIAVPWVEGWDGILRSLEKNGFAGFNYDLKFLITMSVLSFFLNVLPYLTIFTVSGPAWFLAVAIVSVIFLIYLSLQKNNPQTLSAFLFHPLGCMLVLFVVWRSAILALKTGGIQWRDTFYKLDQLKK